ncbi:MAG: hypothetical protein QY315_04400 [Saprospiraceae bacterium]|nr:MAG: hypothetical protein QY315_04400 [Saprospiraceae bacterium]
MKYKIIILIVACLFCNSCDKDKEMMSSIPIYTPYAPSNCNCDCCQIESCLKNGHLMYYTYSTARLLNPIYKNVFAFNCLTAYIDSVSKRESFGFSYIPKLGRQTILHGGELDVSRSCSYNLWIDDGDVPSKDDYYLDTTRSNFVEITHLDTINRIVGGRAEAHFKIKDAVNKFDKSNPDKVDLTDIKFYGSYVDW